MGKARAIIIRNKPARDRQLEFRRANGTGTRAVEF